MLQNQFSILASVYYTHKGMFRYLCLFLEINTVTKFLLFKMEYVIGEGSLFDYWHLLLLYYVNTWMNLQVHMWMNLLVGVIRESIVQIVSKTWNMAWSNLNGCTLISIVVPSLMKPQNG